MTATVLDQVSAQRMAATVAALAGEAFAGRRVGSNGGAAARGWLAEHLAAAGATVSFDAFPVGAVPEVYERPTLVWSDGTIERHLVFGREFAVHLSSADRPAGRRGGLVVAGHGNAAGRWVVVPPGALVPDLPGALGHLIRRNVDAGGWQYTMLAGPAAGPLPVLALDTDTHATVLGAAEAGLGWVAGNTPIRRIEVTGTNVHASWPGAVQVLLTAHYDGVGDLPGLRQPGAADNASGVAVVLESARVLAGVLPVEVALLDGEEVGALGSAHHAGHTDKPVVNVDGAGQLNDAVAVEAGGPAHGLLAALDQAGRVTGVPLVAGSVASDNRRYAAAGLPAVGIGAGMPGYHSAADTPDRVDPDTLAAVAKLVVATALLVSGRAAHVSSLLVDRR
jgi:aminopeptidase YwaD